MNKKLLFRADGNLQTGLGHVYRLLGLVQMLKEEFECIFITNINTPDSIFSNTYKVLRIPEDIDTQHEPNWLKENFQPKDYIIICDGYQFVSQYQKSIKEIGYKLIYIDDLMSEHMYADIVINHSPEINQEGYIKEQYTQLALGTKYALLRSEFLNQIDKKRIAVKEKNIFVCFGGSDPHEFSYKVTMALLKIKEVGNIFVVMGASNKDKNLIRLQKTNKLKIHLFKNLGAKELLNVMLMSELAIVPSSTILYELCCANIPCLSGYYVDNQKKIHAGFLKNKAIYSFGDISEFKIYDFALKIDEVLSLTDHNEQLKHQKEMFDNYIKSRYLKLISSLC